MTTEAKRKRGRPRKPVYAPKQPTSTFRAQPPGKPSKREVEKLVLWHRNILESHQFLGLDDKEGTLTAWSNALADAIEAGDAYRVGYYAKMAMRELAFAVLYEPFQAPDGRMVPLIDFADKGRTALKGDARRAVTQKIRRG